MPEASGHAAARLFASDLRKIREARGISIDDVNDETKIPRGLIESFEATALVNHPQFNEVYLRSFVRTYAQVVDVDAQVALAALEEALAGRYQGALAARYLGAAPAAGPEPPQEASPVAEPPSPEAPVPPSRPPEQPAGTPVEASPVEGAPVEEVPVEGAPVEEVVAEGERVQEAPAKEGGIQEAPSISPERPSLTARQQVQWRMPEGVVHPRSQRNYRQWLYIVGGVVLLLGLIWAVLNLIERPVPEVVEQPVAAVEDATADTVAAEPAAEPLSRAVLGDTLHVYVVAASAKVDPIRVTIDDDLRRPYWIEQGDSLLFRPTNRIVIEERLEAVRINLEGTSYPTSRVDAQGRVVITRDTARAFFEDRARRP